MFCWMIRNGPITVQHVIPAVSVCRCDEEPMESTERNVRKSAVSSACPQRPQCVPKCPHHVLTGIQGDDNLQWMQVGAVLRKVKSRTWKKQRYFRLQDDGATIWYKSKKAGHTHCTCKVM